MCREIAAMLVSSAMVFVGAYWVLTGDLNYGTMTIVFSLAGLTVPQYGFAVMGLWFMGTAIFPMQAGAVLKGDLIFICGSLMFARALEKALKRS